eukprot:COSAG04_NODE_1062_length_8500_cov_11.838353_6_plen_250_part_00
MDNENAQKYLAVKGLYEGAIDGSIGEMTQKAVMRFQRAHGLQVDGVIGGNTKRRIHEETVGLQQFLAAGKKGRFEGTSDGIMGVNTTRAIRDYQRDNGLLIDGIIGENTQRHMDYPFRKPGVRNPQTQRPIVVGCKCKVNKLTRVDDSSNHFDLDFTIYHSWQDENFRDVVDKSRNADEIQWERHWQPAIEFGNDVAIQSTHDTAHDLIVYKHSSANMVLDGQTRVLQQTRVKGTFVSPICATCWTRWC